MHADELFDTELPNISNDLRKSLLDDGCFSKMEIDNLTEEFRSKNIRGADILKEPSSCYTPQLAYETKGKGLFFNLSYFIFSLRFTHVDPLICNGSGCSEDALFFSSFGNLVKWMVSSLAIFFAGITRYTIV
jgi:hypothetical protein